MLSPPGWGLLAAISIAGATGVGLLATFPRSASVTVFRWAVALLAAWSLLATTAVVALLAKGAFGSLGALLRSPSDLFAPPAVLDWALGAAGAFGIFFAAFVLCQGVGRGLLRVLRPTPIAWPARLPRPGTPTRLLSFRSETPDAFTFTLLRPRFGVRWRREEVILVSDRLLHDLTPVEWEAVLAHEIAHVRGLDGRYLTFLRTFARLMRWDPILAVVADRLTRREEFRADAEAAELTGRPRALARAIFKASQIAPARPGSLSGLLGPGGPRGRRQAVERIRRLVALAESGRFPEEPGG